MFSSTHPGLLIPFYYVFFLKLAFLLIPDEYIYKCIHLETWRVPCWKPGFRNLEGTILKTFLLSKHRNSHLGISEQVGQRVQVFRHEDRTLKQLSGSFKPKKREYVCTCAFTHTHTESVPCNIYMMRTASRTLSCP